jgi:hypothetical protein
VIVIPNGEEKGKRNETSEYIQPKNKNENSFKRIKKNMQ